MSPDDRSAACGPPRSTCWASDYVGTARSKGAAGVALFRGHVLRNAAIPTVSIIGVNLGYLVGGSLVIEKVFAIPGLGSLMINAIFARDFPTIQAVALFVAALRDRRRDPHRRRLHRSSTRGSTSASKERA